MIHVHSFWTAGSANAFCGRGFNTVSAFSSLILDFGDLRDIISILTNSVSGR